MMNRGLRTILALAVLIAGMVSCIDAPSFDSVPEISNVRLQLSSNPLQQGDTAFQANILFDFSDGDGDIGRLPDDSTSLNLFMENTQFDEPYIETNYSIPYIPSNGGVPDITGTIKVQLNSSTFDGFCAAIPDIEQVEYRLWIKDRAGNQSNVVDVPPIPVNCN